MILRQKGKVIAKNNYGWETEIEVGTEEYFQFIAKEEYKVSVIFAEEIKNLFILIKESITEPKFRCLATLPLAVERLEIKASKKKNRKSPPMAPSNKTFLVVSPGG